jgi:hypothetical protein
MGVAGAVGSVTLFNVVCRNGICGALFQPQVRDVHPHRGVVVTVHSLNNSGRGWRK